MSNINTIETLEDILVEVSCSECARTNNQQFWLYNLNTIGIMHDAAPHEEETGHSDYTAAIVTGVFDEHVELPLREMQDLSWTLREITQQIPLQASILYCNARKLLPCDPSDVIDAYSGFYIDGFNEFVHAQAGNMIAYGDTDNIRRYLNRRELSDEQAEKIIESNDPAKIMEFFDYDKLEADLEKQYFAIDGMMNGMSGCFVYSLSF